MNLVLLIISVGYLLLSVGMLLFNWLYARHMKEIEEQLKISLPSLMQQVLRINIFLPIVIVLLTLLFITIDLLSQRL